MKLEAPVLAAGAVFWQASNLRHSKVQVYTPSGGVADFLAAGESSGRGVADFGTDGKDMVWIEARGGPVRPEEDVDRARDDGRYEHVSILTAPFTTAPTAIRARRLREESGSDFGTSGFVVGCGYAARLGAEQLRVVRLSDGRSWSLRSGAGWRWSSPMAMTCQELFVRVSVEGRIRLARVRLEASSTAATKNARDLLIDALRW
ncbi:MAG: hypothetical protein QM765_33020 [Myxococcales bacterium]